jgi:FkbM family methyltransferase
MTDTPVPEPSSPPAARPGRRAVLLGGLAGLAAGGAAGYAARRPRAQPAPAEPDEIEAERRAAAHTGYAQFGEDLILAGLLPYFGVANPSYLDIGAHEPIRGSNTYLFSGPNRGRGVLVEPNVDLSDKIRKYRPTDTLLVAGIGVDETPEADYYVMSANGVNTFDKAQVGMMERTTELRLVRTVKMPLLNINKVIAEHFGGAAPDFISIDIEGLDLAVLKTLDYARFRPKFICVETVIFATLAHNPETAQFLTARGYELRGMTHANMIFVDQKLTVKTKK